MAWCRSSETVVRGAASRDIISKLTLRLTELTELLLELLLAQKWVIKRTEAGGN